MRDNSFLQFTRISFITYFTVFLICFFSFYFIILVIRLPKISLNSNSWTILLNFSVIQFLEYNFWNFWWLKSEILNLYLLVCKVCAPGLFFNYWFFWPHKAVISSHYSWIGALWSLLDRHMGAVGGVPGIKFKSVTYKQCLTQTIISPVMALQLLLTV